MAAQGTALCLRLGNVHVSSAAASFLQIAPKRCFQSPSTPLLDFLAPRAQLSTLSAYTSRTDAQSTRLGSLKRQRNFTTTGKQQATRAIVNSTKDDDGNEMLLDITPRAAKRLHDIMTKDANPNLALRIQVESGGCHGFQYLLSLSTIPALSEHSSSPSTQIPVESTPALNTSSSDPNATSSAPASATLVDTLATAPTSVDGKGKGDDVKELEEEDVVFEDEASQAKVVIDVASLELLKGSRVEYTTGLIGSQFTVINPNSSSNCGCGTSFDIKI